MLLLVLDEYFSKTDRWGAEFCQEHHTLEIIPFSLSPEHRDRETDSDHDDMVQDHEELSAQIATDG